MVDHGNIDALLARGVAVVAPDTVYLGREVNPEKIAPRVRIMPGCRILGQHTSIGPGSVLGEEAPVTVLNCQLGANVSLKGGFFSGATLLDGVSFGSAAHVRPGTLLEELVSCAHSVGLKQTVLLPYVVTGSLVNFCDCLMAGGTSRRDHSEVGSSYVHFNYTPNRDKATASLIGDVPRGVMLNQPPIFLGGQGGLVGPARIAYGVVAAAGTIIRRDQIEEGRLVFCPSSSTQADRPFTHGAYGDVRRKVANSLRYIGNIHALYAWYLHARSRFLKSTPHGRACLEGALGQIRSISAERLTRMDELAGNIAEGLEKASGSVREGQEAFFRQWPATKEALVLPADNKAATPPPERLSMELEDFDPGTPYLEAIKALTPEAKQAGTAWLQEVVDAVDLGLTGPWSRGRINREPV